MHVSKADILKRPNGVTVTGAPTSHQVHLYNTVSISGRCCYVIRILGAYLFFFASHAHFPSSRTNFSSVFCHLDRLAVVSKSLSNPNNMYHARNRRFVTMELRIAVNTSDDYCNWKCRRLACWTQEVNEGRLRNTAGAPSRGTDIVVADIRPYPSHCRPHVITAPNFRLTELLAKRDTLKYLVFILFLFFLTYPAKKLN
jgi:hypothetical protein